MRKHSEHILKVCSLILLFNSTHRNRTTKRFANLYEKLNARNRIVFVQFSHASIVTKYDAVLQPSRLAVKQIFDDAVHLLN